MFLIFILTFATTIMIVFSIYNITARNKILILKRLNDIKATQNLSIEDEKLSKPFYQRVIHPIISGIGEILAGITPKERLNHFQKKIITAGHPFHMGVNEWVTLQALLMAGAPAITIIIGFLGIIDFKKMLIFITVEVLLGYLLPNLILNSKIQQRQKEIISVLPDILDLLTVSVEAGLGFDAALGKVVEKIPGVLSEEFDKVLQEIKMGKLRKDALKSMAERVGVVDLTTFIASVIQADQLGVSLSGVLRIQSNQMRLKRRQRAQEKAMKAPIKMLLPMVFFIFPTIFTVLLGPAMIKLMEVLKK